jgi:hypothetical protein
VFRPIPFLFAALPVYFAWRRILVADGHLDERRHFLGFAVLLGVGFRLDMDFPAQYFSGEL